jgi:hypothetical protein
MVQIIVLVLFHPEALLSLATILESVPVLHVRPLPSVNKAAMHYLLIHLMSNLGIQKIVKPQLMLLRAQTNVLPEM